MTIYKFPNGKVINLNGQIQKEERPDGWYIVVNDQEVKVKDEARADRFIEIYNRDKDKYYHIPNQD